MKNKIKNFKSRKSEGILQEFTVIDHEIIKYIELPIAMT